MDTKRLISSMALGVGLILLYMSLLPWIDKTFHLNPPPAPAETATTTAPATAPTTSVAVASTAPTTQGAGEGPTIAAAAAGPQVVPATQPSPAPEPAALGSAKADDPQFALQLNPSPIGGGIDSVVLNSFKRAARSAELYSFEQVPPDRLDTEPLATRSVTVDGKTYDTSSVRWTLVRQTATVAEYAAELQDAGQTVLVMRKTYEVLPRSSEGEGYEISAAFAFFNRSGKPLTVRTAFNGPTLPPAETNRSPDRQVIGGYHTGGGNVEVVTHPIEDFKPDKNNGEIDLSKSGNNPAVWAGAASNYFGAVVLPDAMVGGTGKADYIDKIVAHGFNIDKEVHMDRHEAFLTFETTDLKLPAGQGVTLPMKVFFGPKWRQVLDTNYYASYPHKYDLMLIIRGGMCGFLTWNWLVWVINHLLSAMHFVFRDWGLAIIGLVAIVRLLLHPITRQSQISMSRMQKLGPEMERLKKKYGDDKEGLNKAMVEFHREQGVGPYLGCLPMFLQMPIWIALYGVLQSTFELRHAPFLWNMTWIHDLAQPDYLIKFTHPVQVWFLELRGINLLPVLLAAVMAIQQQFMPKPAAATPEQMQQQKMMMWLSPVMFLFFFYSLPSGLNLYIFTSTAVGIIESKIIRDHLKQREEAEKAGRVFVETKPTRGSKRGGNGRPANDPKKPAGVAGWLGARWAKLLEQAEQVRAEQERQKKGRSR